MTVSPHTVSAVLGDALYFQPGALQELTECMEYCFMCFLTPDSLRVYANFAALLYGTIRLDMPYFTDG